LSGDGKMQATECANGKIAGGVQLAEPHRAVVCAAIDWSCNESFFSFKPSPLPANLLPLRMVREGFFANDPSHTDSNE
jgi:hypothetical protein